LDFDTNKKIAEEVAIIPSKRLRNQIAGFVTHLMKRIQRGGSVRGISLKLQEEERERRLDFIPERSILDVDSVEIDADTADLLKSIDFAELGGIQVQQAQHAASYVKRPAGKSFGGDRKGGDRKQGDRKPRPQKPEASAAAAPAAVAAQ
jgi:small subunit ribosomal protein S17e